MDTIGDEFFPQLKKRLNLAKTDPEWQAANEYFKFVLQSPDKRYQYIITLQKTLGTMKSFQTRIYCQAVNDKTLINKDHPKPAVESSMISASRAHNHGRITAQRIKTGCSVHFATQKPLSKC